MTIIAANKGVWLVGAEGFIGSHIADELTKRGHELISYQQIKDSLDRTGIAPDDRIGSLVWCGGFSSVAGCEAEPLDALARNTLACIHDVTMAVAKGVRQVVLLGTTREWMRTVYAHTKMFAELLGRHLCERNGVYLCELALPTVYGPGQRRSEQHGVIPKWIECLKSGQKAHVYFGSGTQRDYVYVRDVAELVANVTGDSDPDGWDGTWQVTSKRTVEPWHVWIELCRLWRDTGGAEALSEKVRDVPTYVLDDAPMMHDTLSSVTPLVDGLRETLDWYLAQPQS